MPLIDNIAEELGRISKVAMKDILERATVPENDSLLRRFQAKYATLELDEILQVQQAVGHRHDEEQPCKVCKIIARKEFELAED